MYKVLLMILLNIALSLFQSVGIKDKADQSKDRTQQLNENAQRAQSELTTQLRPHLDRYKLQMDEISMKNKATKQSVEGIIR